MSNSDFEQIIEDLQDRVDKLQKYLEKISCYEKDPQTALFWTRKATEAICKEVCVIEELVENREKIAKKTLEDLYRFLSPAIPRKIYLQLLYIQNLTNLASHDQSSSMDEVDNETSQACLNAFAIVVNWFVESYSHDISVARIQLKSPLLTEVNENNIADKSSWFARGIIHALPPAPQFSGRKEELARLLDFVSSRDKCNKILALIALGGAGKTALVSELLAMISCAPGKIVDGVFVWSFYIDQDVSNFLREAYIYFSNGRISSSTGRALLYELQAVIPQDKRFLLVMDGLERVQRAQSTKRGLFGELEDPLLRQVISRLGAGLGNTKCIITSRFPVADLTSWQGRGYCPLELDQLAEQDALELLHRNGLTGTESELAAFLKTVGTHALTLDHASVFIREFKGGCVAKAWSFWKNDCANFTVERRLPKVLQSYEAVLTSEEHAILIRLSLFRFGISAEDMHRMFSREGKEPSENGETSKNLTLYDFKKNLVRLVQLHLVLIEGDGKYNAHPAIRDYFAQQIDLPGVAHGVIFDQLRDDLFELADELEFIKNFFTKLHSIILNEWLIDLMLEKGYRWVEELIEKDLMERFVSDYVESQGLNQEGAFRSRLEKLKIHLAYIDVADLAHIINLKLGEYFYLLNYAVDSPKLTKSDYRPPNLQRLKSLSTIFQQRIELLTNRHKDTINEIDRKEIHKFAIRFSNILVSDTLPKEGQNISLTRKPGEIGELDPKKLNLIEELIYHALEADLKIEACHIYSCKLRGVRSLGFMLGEFARGERICRMILDKFDRAGHLDLFNGPKNVLHKDRGWFLRGTGEFEESAEELKIYDRMWVGAIRILQGRLHTILSEDGCSYATTRSIASYLRGEINERSRVANLGWGEPLSEALLACIARDLNAAKKFFEISAPAMSEIASSSLETDKAHLLLSWAEFLRLKGEPERALSELEKTNAWIFNSSSVEHLGLYHLIKGRIFLDLKNFRDAATEVFEGIHIAEKCKMGLLHIDLQNVMADWCIHKLQSQDEMLSKSAREELIAQAEKAINISFWGLLPNGECPGGERAVSELVIMGSRQSECHYVWAQIESFVLLGKLKFLQGYAEKSKFHFLTALEMSQKLDSKGWVAAVNREKQAIRTTNWSFQKFDLRSL